MASSSKKRTTFAKLNREAAVRDRRQQKQAKRAARKLEDGQAADIHATDTEDTSHLDVAHVDGVIDGLDAKPHRH